MKVLYNFLNVGSPVRILFSEFTYKVYFRN